MKVPLSLLLPVFNRAFLQNDSQLLDPGIPFHGTEMSLQTLVVWVYTVCVNNLDGKANDGPFTSTHNRKKTKKAKK